MPRYFVTLCLEIIADSDHDARRIANDAAFACGRTTDQACGAIPCVASSVDRIEDYDPNDDL
jgi:hypothetical protein